MDIIFSSATQLAAAIRTGDISATEVLDAHLAQIERHNPALNAIVTLDAEAARARARAADQALARGESWGPLHGLPFTLKDAHSTAGMRTTVGFPPLDHVPQEDSTITARLKEAGGVLIGKTNVPPLLADYQSNNPIFGRTNNPWNIERTSGGSSGGGSRDDTIRYWHRYVQLDPHSSPFLRRIWAETDRASRIISRLVSRPACNPAQRADHVVYWADRAYCRGSGIAVYDYRRAGWAGY